MSCLAGLCPLLAPTPDMTPVTEMGYNCATAAGVTTSAQIANIPRIVTFL